MNRQMHATLARVLIERCGGLDGALSVVRLRANRERLPKSMLSNYQNANATEYMPADIVDALEQHCGERIYSGRLGPAELPTAGELLDDASQAIEDTTAFFGAARRMVAEAKERRSTLSPRLTEMLHRLLLAAEEDLARAETDIMAMSERSS
jgi:hypothetical protein